MAWSMQKSVCVPLKILKVRTRSTRGCLRSSEKKLDVGRERWQPGELDVRIVRMLKAYGQLKYVSSIAHLEEHRQPL